MTKEYLCEFHGRRTLLHPPDCPGCKPRETPIFMRDVFSNYAGEANAAVERAIRLAADKIPNMGNGGGGGLSLPPRRGNAGGGGKKTPEA